MTAPAIEMLVRRVRAAMRARGIDVAPFNQHNGDFVVLDALRRRGIATVLDVGANRGQFGQWLFGYGFRGAIHSFEPLPAVFAELEAATRGWPTWKAHALALAAADGEAVLNIGRNDQTSSLNSLDAVAAESIEPLEVVGSTSVVTRRLDGWLAEQRVDPACSFLKIDVQGGEAGVLEGAGVELNRFAMIQVETALVPVYNGESQLPTMIDFFRARGFVVRGLRPVYFHPQTREMMQVDLIVERP